MRKVSGYICIVVGMSFGALTWLRVMGFQIDEGTPTPPGMALLLITVGLMAITKDPRV